MIIEICGQETAVSLVADARERTSVISITSTEDGDVAFPANENVAAILRLRFNDLTEAYDEEGIPYGRPLPEQRDFEGLRAFVDALKGDRLIVHCWEGASRSAAVATATHIIAAAIETATERIGFRMIQFLLGLNAETISYVPFSVKKFRQSILIPDFDGTMFGSCDPEVNVSAINPTEG